MQNCTVCNFLVPVMQSNLKIFVVAAALIAASVFVLGWRSVSVSNYHSTEELAVLRALAGDLPQGENALFAGSGKCAGCHGNDPMGFANNTDAGWDVNPTDLWRSSIMANSGKDPFWRAKVTHEVAVNPEHQELIENKCTSCHTPLGHFNAHYTGQSSYSFAEAMSDSLALDGVSCNACHQQSPIGIGTRFSGDLTFSPDTIYGPFGGGKDENPILGQPMTSFVGFEPLYGEHITKSEICAGCHTLITQTIDLDGQLQDNYFVEQATYHEWLNSVYGGDNPTLRQECQSCHMPKMDEPVVISANYAFLEPRGPIGLHYLVGSNTFMLEMFKNNIELLGLSATEAQFDTTITETLKMLQEQSVILEVEETGFVDDTLSFDVLLENLAGHKFPSGYPSRRAYLEFIATDANGNTLFHSGALDANYEVVGHDDDFEPHYDVIRAEDEVQIYELVIGDANGDVTTVLLRGATPLKDNRLTPLGFSTSHAVYDSTLIAGAALNDPKFNNDGGGEGSGTDRVSYRIALQGYEGLVNVTARLWYQAAPPKWNEEMFAVSTPEIELFESLYLAQGAQPVLVDEASLSVTASYITSRKVDRGFTVYPNPTVDGRFVVNVANRAFANRTYTLYSVSGQIITQGVLRFGNNPINIAGAEGSYIVAIDTPQGVRTERILKLQ